MKSRPEWPLHNSHGLHQVVTLVKQAEFPFYNDLFVFIRGFLLNGYGLEVYFPMRLLLMFGCKPAPNSPIRPRSR